MAKNLSMSPSVGYAEQSMVVAAVTPPPPPPCPPLLPPCPPLLPPLPATTTGPPSLSQTSFHAGSSHGSLPGWQLNKRPANNTAPIAVPTPATTGFWWVCFMSYFSRGLRWASPCVGRNATTWVREQGGRR